MCDNVKCECDCAEPMDALSLLRLAIDTRDEIIGVMQEKLDLQGAEIAKMRALSDLLRQDPHFRIHPGEAGPIDSAIRVIMELRAAGQCCCDKTFDPGHCMGCDDCDRPDISSEALTDIIRFLVT